MHTLTLLLLISVAWMPSCDVQVYPWNYLACLVLILAHQLFDFFLYGKRYLVDWTYMPPMS